MAEEEHEGASIQELLIEACRRNNTDLFTETIAGLPEDQLAKLLNGTTTVLGNHLYHEAAARGHYEIIDLLLDQTGFECDPVNRTDKDTPLHSAVRWINSEPPAQRAYGCSLVELMLDAGSNPRLKNKGGLTAYQLVDPRNTELRELIQKHEYANLNAGDFVDAADVHVARTERGTGTAAVGVEDDDAEFSGSDEEERAEWEKRRRAKGKR